MLAPPSKRRAGDAATVAWRRQVVDGMGRGKVEAQPWPCVKGKSRSGGGQTRMGLGTDLVAWGRKSRDSGGGKEKSLGLALIFGT
jgi:hypothetical protein